MKIVVCLFMAVFLAGCASPGSGTTSRKGAEIAVFQGEAKPSQEYTVLVTLVGEEVNTDDPEFLHKFKRKAAKFGGDAIIIRPQHDRSDKTKTSTGYAVDVVQYK